ncbi:helix-turn-helix domain-containing protein [Cryobacterium sp. TMS1-20-1]|uniref:helix-turn-helix domain-containing protein n=1 Tax=Cryobacterium sp. TMS1-20-1 TaxID=1259223 RepID=UPI00141B5209|nr:helix-turn-helix domain-containing protein [Cryobacterium sp. TMS1-20-1]
MTTFDGPTIGKRVARYRQMNGQSAEELATRSGKGFSRPVIANIETGRKKELTVSQLIGLSIGLGVSPAALLFDIHEPMSESGLPMRGPAVEQPQGNIPVIEAVEWMSSRDPGSTSRDSLLSAEEHTRAVINGFQALDEQYAERSKTRQQIEDLRTQSDGEEFTDRNLRWEDYLRDSLQKQDARIAELLVRLASLGVNTSWGA